MSREVEFRVYIKPLKRYATGYETILYHHQCNMKPSWTVNISPEEWYGDEDLIVEQFTGLIDTNGKKLYEGDILGGVFGGCYVGWCDTTKTFELFNCYEHYCMACDGDILWCELSDSNANLEVIGNIHETNMEELCPKE